MTFGRVVPILFLWVMAKSPIRMSGQEKGQLQGGVRDLGLLP